MNPDIGASIVEEGSKLLGDLAKVAVRRSLKRMAAETQKEAPEKATEGKNTSPPSEKPAASDFKAGTTRPLGSPPRTASQLPIELPTSEETTIELKRRLRRELNKLESDLVGGLKIAERPCDCLDDKHADIILAKTEELIPQDPSNLVYQEIVQWVKDNEHKGTIEAIQSGRYAADYPYMANEIKNFRKRVMGTVASTESITGTIGLNQAKKMAADDAAIASYAIIEDNPIKKFCCKFGDACAPPELLEEGKFSERIAWLRAHYAEAHPNVWGKE